MALSTVEQLMEKWSPVLDAPGVPAITDMGRRQTTAVLLENTEQDIIQSRQMLSEAGPTNQTGQFGSAYPADGTGLAKYDPILISMVRRAAPQMLAYDICGVQPLRQPTGMIFALRSRYGAQNSGVEALFNEADTDFSSGAGTHAGTDPTANSGYTTGTGTATATGEAFGAQGGTAFAEMSFTIESMTVTAKTRALKAGYSVEFAQDVKNLHGLDADAELSNILSTEILSEVNREVLRTIYLGAKPGAEQATVAGTFDLLLDSDGRWLAERHKGLMFQIEREANQIAKETRRGKGNILVCSSDVASALAMAGQLDYAPALANNLNVDETGATFAGVIKGSKMRVYIDPYTGSNGNIQFMMVGYKGSSAWDAGVFYCPYVPLQIVRTTDPTTMSPVLAYRLRYGMANNPFFNAGGRTNAYYRISKIANVM